MNSMCELGNFFSDLSCLIREHGLESSGPDGWGLERR